MLKTALVAAIGGVLTAGIALLWAKWMAEDWVRGSR